LTVRLNAPAITQHPAHVTANEGQSASFTCAASGTLVSYRWQKDGADIAGATSATFTIAAVTHADAAAYRCVASNTATAPGTTGGGSATSNSALLTIRLDPPQITQHPQNVTVTEGEPFSLTCAASGTLVSYEWEQDGMVIAGATEPTFAVASAVHTDAGSYRCLAYNTTDGAYSNAATVTVDLVAPVVTTHPQSLTVTEGQSASFTCSATGTLVTYRWQKDQQDIPGATAATHLIAAAALTDPGAYRCIASNSGGNTPSSEATLTVVPLIPVITQQPQNVTVADGDSFQLTVTATGGVLTYQWQRAGVDIAGATSATYSKQATPSDAGAQYRVIVSNTSGSVTSNVATITLSGTRPPTLSVNNAPQITVTDDSIVITGTAIDNGGGGIETTLTSSQFPGQEFGVVLNPDGNFEGELPLGLGENVITITVTDSQGNTTTRTVVVTVQATAVPRITIAEPVGGAVVTADRIDVAGYVRSSLPADQIRLRLGTRVVFPIGSGAQYAFAFDDVPLALGLNVLQVDAETVYGTVSSQVIVSRVASAPPDQEVPPPIIELAVRQPRVFVTGDFVSVQGVVRAQTCVQSVSVNGAAAQITGSGTTISFDHDLSFPAGASELAITVVARDCNQRTAEAGYTAVRDDAAPLVAVAGLALAPAVNTVQQTPYRVTGTVSDDHLAGLTANDQSIAALPSGGGQWSFAFDVALSRTSDLPVTIDAWDFAGQHTTRSVVLRLDTVRDIAVLVPASGAVIAVSGASTSLEVTARVAGLEPGDRVVASFDGSPELALAVAGEYATVRLNVPAQAGSHEIKVSARSQAGALLASSANQFEFQQEADVPVEVVRQEPLPDSAHVEANVPIHLFFNRAVDPARLQVRVLETAHGKIYGTQPEGSDLTAQSVVQMEEVHRDQAPVPGGAQNFPGNATFAFYPSRDYAYGATVMTEVLLDGDPIWRSQFNVRALPTLVHGFVGNHVALPLAGIEIELIGMNRRAVTDDDGSWNFGFGEAPERMLAAGRYRAVINPGRKNPRFGSIETFLNVTGGELDYQGVTKLPIVNDAEPMRRIESRQSAPAILASGDLVLDLVGTDLTFPDGLAHGDVHVQFMAPHEIGYRCLESALPDWAFIVQPIAVRSEGPVRVTVTLPTRDGSYEYLASLPELVLIVGLDQESLLITPVGVGRIDRENTRLVSEGPLAFERLDVIGISSAVAGLQQIALGSFVAGELTLAELTALLESK
jgi:hypothetical protein